MKDEGILVDIKIQNETWSSATLEDGTIIYVRPMPLAVRKFKKKDRDGKPTYTVKSTVVVKVTHAKLPKVKRK